MPDADIRKQEIDSIVSFLSSSSKRVLIVQGDSGMGKSYCVDSAIMQERLIKDRILSYTFYPKFDSEDDDFPRFLYQQFQKRKLIGFICNLMNKIGFSFDRVDLQAETPRLHLPFNSPTHTEPGEIRTGGLRVNFRFKPAWYNSDNNGEEVVKNYLSCFRDKIDCIHIINYRKNRNGSTKSLNDILIAELVKQVCAMSECDLKMIIETPDTDAELSISKDLDAALKNRIQHIKLSPLNDEDTIKLFKHYHPDCEIPVDLRKLTSGKPYYIQYYNNQGDSIPNGDNTKLMFSSLSEGAEIIMYELVALGWKATREQLRKIFSPHQDMEKCLMELNRKKLVSFDEDEVRINEPISFNFLFSNDYRSRLFFFGHHKVISYLSNKKTRTHEEQIEFMRQYKEIGKVSMAAQCAFRYAYQCYTNQDYQFLEDCLSFTKSHEKKDDILLKSRILSLQVSICLGDVKKAENYIQQSNKENSFSIENRVKSAVAKISQVDDKKRQQYAVYNQYIEEEEEVNTSEILLYAQYLYLNNKFEEAIRILNSIIHSVDVWYQGRIEGILTACYSALGKRQEMKEAYKKACQNARDNNDLELQYELKRLIPQVEDQEVRDKQFAQFLKEKHPAEYSYLVSKIYHNFAVDRIFEVNDKDAYKYLLVSACFFERGKYVEYSYSCICLSAVFIVNNSLKNAKAILESCEVFLHEQYDKICWNINMSIISFLNEESGYQYLSAANTIENDQENGLNDPYFTFLLIYNKLCFDILSGEEVQAKAFEKLDIPVGCFQNSKKEQRRAMILDRCKDNVRKDDFIEVRKDDFIEISKALGLPLFEVATLQFFDFNCNVLKKDFISGEAVDDSLH